MSVCWLCPTRAHCHEPARHAFRSRVNIAAVERDTGLSKDTLRVWERRYGFPSPERDAAGRAALLRRADREAARRQAAARRRPPPGPADRPVHRRTGGSACSGTPRRRRRDERGASCGDLPGDCCKSHDVQGLRAAARPGPCTPRAGALRDRRGRAAEYARSATPGCAGSSQIFEEHLYTESVQVVLRSAHRPPAEPARGAAARAARPPCPASRTAWAC